MPGPSPTTAQNRSPLPLAGDASRTARRRKPAGARLDAAGASHLAEARSRAYLLLSAGFRYPSQESLIVMREDCRELQRLLSGGKAPALSGLAAIQEALHAVSGELSGLRQGRFETEYLKVFTHVIASDCDPCETAYTATHLFQQTQKLADLNGFYRAFGVEPTAERADHVSVELEFMAYLAQKETHAWSNGRPRRAGFMCRTQRGFLEDHLGPWVRTFARFIEKKAETGVYASLAALTLAFFEAEFDLIGAQVRELTGPPKPLPLLMQKEAEDDDDECPVFATAEPRPVIQRSEAPHASLEVSPSP